MNKTLTIAKRELTSLFYSPIAYVVLGLFSFGASLIFLNSFDSSAPATLRPTYEGIIWLMIFLVPAISMRLLSDEYRNGTIEPLMTSPISDAQVIIGKWLGAVGFFVTLLLPFFVLMGILEAYAKPDYGPILTGLLGVFLVGALYLAIGTFASSTTQNQIIAFLLTVFIICIFTIAMYFLPRSFLGTQFPFLKEAMFFMTVNMQFDAFSKGLVDTSNFVYFISGIFLFLFFAVLMLQSRRWR